MPPAIRRPAVSGQFYPSSKEDLERDIAGFVDLPLKNEDAIGAVVPHAGYIYSGKVACSVFSRIKPKTKYVILGPNHTGTGETFGISPARSWETPLGDVKVDAALAKRMASNSRLAKEDSACHEFEHSIEVELPLLQYFAKEFAILPIVLSYADLDTYRRLGEEIARAVIEEKRAGDTLIIASSDMTHYEAREEAEKKDRFAIDAILRLDEGALIREVQERGISMCGFAPVAVMISAAKILGATGAKLVDYMTSGDTSGDYSSVVGYAGIIVS